MTRPGSGPLLTVVLVLLVLLMAGPRPAFAHAGLVGMEPADGAVLDTAPAALVLRFNEPVQPLVARLIDPEGRTRVLPPPSASDAQTLTFALPPDLARGTFVLSWRVVSGDGHPVAGGQSFSIGAPSAPGAAAVPAGDPLVRAGLWLARFALMASLVLGVGGTVFLGLAGLTPRPGTDALLHGLLFAGPVAGAAVLGFQGLDALGEPVAALVRPEIWTTGLTATTYGPGTLLALAACLAALAARELARFRLPARLLGGLALGAAAGAFAAAGHAASAPPRWLTVPAVFLHGACVLLWPGAFLPLLDALARSGEDRTRALAAFGRVILPVTAVLVASGLFLADLQLQAPAALWTTAYGQVLLLKLALVAGLFGLAALNRFRLTAPALAGSPTALSRSVRAELLLTLAILAVAGLWRFTPPPRLLALTAPPVAEIRVAAQGLSARVALAPARVGATAVRIDDLTRDGAPLVPLSVTVELSKPSFGLGPFSHPAVSGKDAFLASGFVLPLDGYWVVRVSVLVDAFTKVELTGLFDVVKSENTFSSGLEDWKLCISAST